MHPADQHLGASWNLRTATFIHAELVAPTPPTGTLFDLPLRSHQRGPASRKKMVETGTIFPRNWPKIPCIMEEMRRTPSPRSRSRNPTLPTPGPRRRQLTHHDGGSPPPLGVWDRGREGLGSARWRAPSGAWGDGRQESKEVLPVCFSYLCFGGHCDTLGG
jgi:hypothetical protein